MPISIFNPLSRRDLITEGAKLSLTTLALLSGLSTKVLADEQPSASNQDIDVLNEILGTEHEGISAYQICVDDSLIQKSLVKTAVLFQDHHKTHRDLLIQKIRSLGGVPASPKTQNAYKSDLNIIYIKTHREALSMILKLELGAANAYIGMLPSTNDHELAKIAGRIAADEVIHWTTLSNLLHLPLPNEALTFGA